VAPLPENNTARLMIDYTSAGIEHTLMLRFPDGVDSAAATLAGQALCLDLSPYVNANDSFIRARWSAKNTDFSLPVSWTPVDGASVGAAFDEDPESAFVSVVGRTLGGRRARWELFTIAKLTVLWPDDNRYGPGESGNADAVVAAFTTAASGVAPARIVGIDGLEVVVYPYLNIAKNAYWTRQQRTSS